MATANRYSLDARRTQIVEHVLTTAGTAGPGRLTTAEIASALAVTHAAIFRYYPTKDQLWDAVGARIERETDAVCAGLRPGAAGAVGTLERLVESYLGLTRRWPALPSILHSREIRFQNDRLQACIQRIEDKWLAALSRIIEDGRRRGEIRPDLAAEDAALAILSLANGLTLRFERADRPDDPASRMTSLWPTLVQGLCQGLCADRTSGRQRRYRACLGRIRRGPR